MRYHCYVAGPYTLGDTEKNVYNALDWADLIIEQFKDEIVPIVPHLSFWWDKYSCKDPQWWYAYTMEQCLRCDILLRLPGQSRGSEEEVKAMGVAGKPVVYTLDQLGAWLNARKLARDGEPGLDDTTIEVVRASGDPLTRPVAYFDGAGKLVANPA